MRSISERSLAVVIPLLAAKIRGLNEELHATDGREAALSDTELDDHIQLQEMLQQYENILDDLRTEYQSALTEGICLPPYEDLVESAMPWELLKWR